MFSFIKYLPLLLKFKSVAEAYKEEKGTGKPWYISRRFLGAALLLGAAFLGIQFGITLDQSLIDQIANNLADLVPAAIGLYGAVMTVVGLIKRDKASPQPPAQSQGGFIAVFPLIPLLLVLCIAAIVAGCCGLHDPWCLR